MVPFNMAASLDVLVDSILSTFQAATSKPEKFLSVQEDANEKFRQITKNLYDFGKKNHAIKSTGGLLELYTRDFEEEQIWQQLELHSEPAFNFLMQKVAKLLSKGKNLSFAVVQKEEEHQDANDIDEDDGRSSSSSGSSVEIPDYLDDDIKNHDSDSDDFGELKFDEFKVLDDDFDDKKERKTKSKPGNKRKAPVDDQFFKLHQMEEFLLNEEKNDGKQKKEVEDDLIDYFDDIPSEDDQDEARLAKYSDFFDPEESEAPIKGLKESNGEDLGHESYEEDDEENDDGQDGEPIKKRVKFNLEDEADESDEQDDEQSDEESVGGDKISSETKSSYEKRQERLQSIIKGLEEEALQPKSWQMLGETKAGTRPENALLEEDLEFDHMSRQAPVVTEETTKSLEDIIRQRIKDQAFDDVVRKIKPVQDPTDFKKQLVLDQEKSKFSLAEIYEQEYLKQQEQQQQSVQRSSLADPIQDKTTENSAAHIRIRKMMNDLFAKLDALSNFHYTPRTPAPEIKIVSNMPSIAMEEIAPIAVSDGNLLAPEEVQDHVRGEVKSASEKEKVDRLRERRKKKSLQGQRRRERERTEKAVEKSNPGLGNKHAKLRTLRQLEQAEKEGTVTLIKDNKKQSIKSSAAFFAQLQEEVSTQVKASRNKTQKSDEKNKRLSGTKLKL